LSLSKVSATAEELVEEVKWIPSATLSTTLAMLLDSFVAMLIVYFA
jgi:hypothetical protein